VRAGIARTPGNDRLRASATRPPTAPTPVRQPVSAPLVNISIRKAGALDLNTGDRSDSGIPVRATWSQQQSLAAIGEPSALFQHPRKDGALVKPIATCQQQSPRSDDRATTSGAVSDPGRHCGLSGGTSNRPVDHRAQLVQRAGEQHHREMDNDEERRSTSRSGSARPGALPARQAARESPGGAGGVDAWRHCQSGESASWAPSPKIHPKGSASFCRR